MKNILLSLFLSGLVLVPLSEAKTPHQSAQPVCATGKLVALFNTDGEVVTRDYRYYRCQLKEDQNGYLVQDFYWPSGKQQSDPVLITKAGLREWDPAAAGVDGLVVGWHENGQKQFTTGYVAGKATGLSTSWYENGQKQAEGQYLDGKATGLWTFWYKNGQKDEEGQFLDGKQTGLWTLWYENSRKQAEIQFKDGKTISQKMWDEDGNAIDLSELN